MDDVGTDAAGAGAGAGDGAGVAAGVDVVTTVGAARIVDVGVACGTVAPADTRDPAEVVDAKPAADVAAAEEPPLVSAGGPSTLGMGAFVAAPMPANASSKDMGFGAGTGAGAGDGAGAGAGAGADACAAADEVAAGIEAAPPLACCMTARTVCTESSGGSCGGGGCFKRWHMTTRCMPMMNSARSRRLSLSTSHSLQIERRACTGTAGESTTDCITQSRPTRAHRAP